VNHADDAAAFALDADQRSVKRNTGDETLRAVDRVKNPAVARGAGLLAELFAEDAVVRKGGGDFFAEQLFRAAIGDGHRRIVALDFDAQIVALKVCEREIAGLTRGGHGEFEASGEVGHRKTEDRRRKSKVQEVMRLKIVGRSNAAKP
jgi:hypothetical protein